MWNGFEFYAILSLIFWIIGLVLLIPNSKLTIILRDIFLLAGIISLGTFITTLWVSLERPPLRTLGETRLWYSEITAIIAFAVYKRYNYRGIIVFPISFAILFVFLNYIHPDIHNKALMPALQSYWFIPHVIAYMVAYSFIGITSFIGMYGLYKYMRGNDTTKILKMTTDVLYVGFGFLTIGLTFGALWAKEAWGHYWTWDPKETWAFLTWGTYLIFMHFQINKPNNHKFLLQYVSFSFIVLLICWFGLSYLPAAQTSVHVYSNTN